MRFSELMYNPLGGDAYEFIELTNVGGLDIDLASAYFKGIDLQFDRFVKLPAGQSIVISPDFAAYRERYPTAPLRAIYAGSLSNRGETVTLYAADGAVLASVTYDDEAGWPLTADGDGDSLELLARGCRSQPPAQLARQRSHLWNARYHRPAALTQASWSARQGSLSPKIELNAHQDNQPLRVEIPAPS